MKRFLSPLAPLLLFLYFQLANANLFQIEDIRVDGLQRVSAGTVFAALPVQAGDLVDEESIRGATRALFQTGYFDDIRIARDNNVLVIIVTERPAVAEINITGNKAIETDQLLQALRDAGLDEGQIFREAVLQGMSQELRRQYVSQGRYGADVIADVTELPRNRVAVTLTIDEGSVAAIKHINIVGNEIFDDDTLVGLFELKTTGLLSFFTNDDKYAREKLSGDLERLESWYLDRGYLKFSIDSTQVSINPDRDTVFITVNINEGEVYTVNKVELAGELILPEEQMRALIIMREGLTYSQALMTKTKEFLTKRLGAEGYTFAEVEAYPEVNDEDQTAKVTFFVNPGKRAYVRRIEFRGNTKTDDQVLRREMRQLEAASASTELIEHSKVRLERLGHFKEVKVETREVPGTNDQLDVFYTVEEQPSGSVGASLGVAQGSGLILGGNIQEKNFLGTGYAVSFGVNRSRYRTSATIAASDPYFTKDGVSAGYRFSFTSTDYGDFDVAEYTSDSFVTGVTFGYPLSEISRISYGVSIESLSIDVGVFPSLEIVQFLQDNGDNYTFLTGNLNWSRSTLNRGILATRGTSQRAGVEFTVPGADLEFVKFSYNAQYFRPITNSLTLRLRTDLGYGIGFGNNDRLPFFKNYYGGGFNSVRGFKRNSMGPQDTPVPGFDDPDPFGGNVKVVGSAELIFPVPFMKDNRSVQAAVFFDAGNIFDTDCNDFQENCFTPDMGELRYSFGIGGTWISGFGPITVSLASPLNDSEFDETEVFQFSMGQGF
ncbi:MAG TPA: outer membrane protein assembly factor BamA [Porticoccaceae bacterium]|nr:outer membrane protein assembly factor BamA [Porticoccaceae bacterium]HCO59744.1 outer membrane protein assembly factor BamA [Porticoccaceae bacterium]